VAARPLNESIVRAGAFAMNTETELRQAFSDYQRGDF
jgi:redox-sensitive bicupin YhaK (pirin superfamily)